MRAATSCTSATLPILLPWRERLPLPKHPGQVVAKAMSPCQAPEELSNRAAYLPPAVAAWADTDGERSFSDRREGRSGRSGQPLSNQ